MQTRKTRLQAYRYGARRSVAALLNADPDGPEAPLRSLTGGVLLGALVAVLVVVVATVYGLMRPGGATAWRDGSGLIVEKESGTRYVYVGGALHPVLNVASARLILGQPALTVRSVSRDSLGATPRGLPVGIPGAPEALPAASALVGAAWTICAEPARSSTGAVATSTRTYLGARPAGLTSVPADSGLLVGTGDGTTYLLWNGARLRIGSTAVLPALGWSGSQVLTVGAAWLNSVPAGPDLATPVVAGLGSPGPALDGQPALVGTVFSVSNVDTANQFYLLQADGLAPVTAVQAALLLGDPATRAAYPGGSVAPVPLNPATVATTPRSAAPAPVGFPARKPPLLDASAQDTAVCAVDPDPAAAGPVQLLTRRQQPAGLDDAAPVDPVTGIPVADAVVVPPADGAVVRSLPAPGVNTGTVYLVTDQGTKYPLASAQVLGPLGYPGVVPAVVPAGLLASLPTGPTLDAAAAGRTVAAVPQRSLPPGPELRDS